MEKHGGRPRMKQILMGLIAAVTLGACSSWLSKIAEAPKIQNETLAVSRMGLQSVDLLLKMDVENPNSYDLPIENLQAELLIKDKSLLSKTWKELPTLSAKQKTHVELPFSLAWSDLYQVGLNLLKEQKVPYQLKGKLSVKGITVPFDEKGEVDLKSQLRL